MITWRTEKMLGILRLSAVYVACVWRFAPMGRGIKKGANEEGRTLKNSHAKSFAIESPVNTKNRLLFTVDGLLPLPLICQIRLFLYKLIAEIRQFAFRNWNFSVQRRRSKRQPLRLFAMPSKLPLGPERPVRRLLPARRC